MLPCFCGDAEISSVYGCKDGFTVGYCRSCGVLRTVNPSPDLLGYYQSGEFHKGKVNGVKNASSAARMNYYDRFEHDYKIAGMRIEQYGKWLSNMPENARWLDFGCGNGAFVLKASQVGYSAFGTEVNFDLARWASFKIGRPIYADVELWQDDYDIVSLHDVIEHLEHPLRDLRRIVRQLNDGGIVIIDTPNADHEFLQRDGMDWAHMKPLEHLWFFRPRDLTVLVSLANLIVFDLVYPIPGKLVAVMRKAVK